MNRVRFITAGESHGPSVTVILEGIPAGLPLRAEQIDHDLARRQRGYGRGGRQKIERDRARIESGVRGGTTLGSPISLHIANRDHANWQHVMSAEPMEPPPPRVTVPRPGHADLAGVLKYGRRDVRDVLERASARETAARVAAGSIARALLECAGVRVLSRVVSIAGEAHEGPAPSPDALFAQQEALESSSLRVLSPEHEARARARILALSHAGDTAGGVFEVVAVGAPFGLGSHVHWDKRLDARLAQAVMSIPAVKAVELGDGWESAQRTGSVVHDPIVWNRAARVFERGDNHAGGVEGGISNGAPIVLRAAMKPLPTLREPLPSVDLTTMTPAPAFRERSDVCAVPAAAVVGEAMLCLVLADALLEKFGGDAVEEFLSNLEAFRARGP